MFIISVVGKALNRLLPHRAWLMIRRAYDPFHSWMMARRSHKLLKKIFPSNDLKIVSGPFEGLRYLGLSHCSALLPKLLGTYELELHGPIRTILKKDYTTVIDVGCAEGFYAVGFAVKLPRARVYGFDLNQDSLSACKRLAQLNQVESRVVLKERCTHDDLSRLIDERTLIICDCEGYEVELLNPERVPALRQADILVEIHDSFVPGASQTLSARFAGDEPFTKISSLGRNAEGISLLASLSQSDRSFAVDEYRGGPMEWAFIEGIA